MANEGVNIPIRTTADPSQVRVLEGSIKSLRQQLKQAKTDYESAAPKSKAWSDAAEKITDLKKRLSDLEQPLKQVKKPLEDLGDSQAAAAKKGVNFGQSMLQGSRAVQDFSAAGIPGMVNNVESLASALGLGASAAGGFTLAFVAIQVLIDNWDTWFGEEKAKEAKAFWAAITPEEAQITRIREANEALEAQSANLERIAESQKAARRQQDQELDFLKQKAELWKGIVQTPEERGDLPSLTAGPKVSAATMEAQGKLKDTQSDTQRRVSAFRDLDKATKEQSQRVDNINKITSFDARFQLANAGDSEALKKLNEQIAISGSGGGSVSPALLKQRDAIQAQMQQRRDQMRAELQNVPGLTDGLPTDPEERDKTLQSRAQQERDRLNEFEQKRLAAFREAEAAAKAQAEAEGTVKQQVNKDKEAFTAPFFKDIGGLDLPPTPGQFAGADQRSGLTEALARLQQGQGASTQAAQQVASAADGVITEITQFQQRSVGTFSVMASIIKATNSSLASLQNEFESYRSNNVR